MLVVLVLLMLGGIGSAGAQSSWAYVSSFRSGSVYVVDVQAERLVRAIAVEDHDGMVGLCATSDGRRLIVVDGNGRSRLRVFEVRTGMVVGGALFRDRRLASQGPAVASLSSDDRFVFCQTRGATQVFDLRAGRFLQRPLAWSGCHAPRLIGGPLESLYALCGASLWQVRLISTPRPSSLPRASRAVAQTASYDFVPRSSAPVSLHSVADIVAMRDGSQVFAIPPVPPMRKIALPQPLPPDEDPTAPKPSPTPTPNPALREGPWRLIAWHAGNGVPRAIDLVKKTDLDKVTPAGLPHLAVSPDNHWLGIVYARRAWILHPDTLEVQWEIYPPGSADGAAFSADSQDLLTVQDGSLLRYRLANRAYRTIVPNQLRTVGSPVVIAAPAPPVPER